MLDTSGIWVSREEYSPLRNELRWLRRKRYRFSGMERDSEPGLSLHGARYFAPGLAGGPRPTRLGQSTLGPLRVLPEQPIGSVDTSGLGGRARPAADLLHPS